MIFLCFVGLYSSFHFVRVWNLVSHLKGGTQIENVWEQGTEKSIWTKEAGNNSKSKAVQLHAMKAPGGRGGNSSYSFLTSALDGGTHPQHHALAVLCPGERTPGTHWTGSWLGPTAGLDAEATRLCLCRGLNPSHPVRSQTLYWLSYPGSRK
jgi:hypothetical protein